MLSHSWLDAIKFRVSRTRRNRRNANRSARRLKTEALEDRCLLAFTAPIDYGVGYSPQDVISAYINNDTTLDLAVANYGDGTVSILLGNGDGTFQPALNTATGSSPLSIAAGDLDGDGKMDLATANANHVSVLWGNGDGTFTAPDSHSVASNPSSVAVGDFTGDGKLDLGVLSNDAYLAYGYYYQYQGYANVLVGSGARTLTAADPTWLGYGYFTAATTANFDATGGDELLAANSQYGYYYGGVTILAADGAGSLQVSSVLYTGADANSFAVGDVNEDGNADLVISNGYYDNSVSVLLGDGLGGFSAAPAYPAGSYPTSVVLGDFTGDSIVDIAVANLYSAGVSVLYGGVDRGYSAPVPFPAGSYPWQLATGDFNGDSWPDLATANAGASTVSVLLNDRSWPPAPPSLSINDVTVTEGDSGTIAAVFTVTRSGNLAGTSTVNYNTVDSGALAGSDYVASSGTLTFAPGAAAMTVTILVKGDLIDEYDQGFAVNLSAASGGVIIDGQGFGQILDNDPTPMITITSKVSRKEGGNNQTTSFVFVVTLSAPSEKYVQVNFATANGTATTASSDYTARSGTLTFAPGVTSQSISVAVRGDKNKEANETFFVNLSGTSNATIAAAQGIGEILDDDTPGGKGKP